MSVNIFLSTVTDEFRDYRDQLRGDLTRHNVDVKVQEDFIDLGTVTLDKLDVYIEHCSAVVHLVGDMTGAPASPPSVEAILAKHPDLPERLPPLAEALRNGEAISYTQLEAWLALYHRKPLLIAKAADDAPRGPRHAPMDASRAAQSAHLARLRAMERFPGSEFTSPDQLAKQIAYTTVLDLLAEEARGAGTATRGAGPGLGGIASMLLIIGGMPLVAEQWARTMGVPLGASVVVALTIAAVGLVMVYSFYFGLLGAGDARLGAVERLGYVAFRSSLVEGSKTSQLYARWLTAFLDRIDRFFGDAGMADRSLFPHAFGLRVAAPLWTAHAYDRCLLLALVYPIATIFLFWAASGHVGPAEAALGLKAAVPSWQRGVAVGAAMVIAICVRRYAENDGWVHNFAGYLAMLCAATILGTIAGKIAGSAAITFACALLSANVVRIAASGFVAVTKR